MLINLANASQSINSEGVLPWRHAKLCECWLFNYCAWGRKTETVDHPSNSSVSVIRINTTAIPYASHYNLRWQICRCKYTGRSFDMQICIPWKESDLTIRADWYVLPNPYWATIFTVRIEYRIGYIETVYYLFCVHFLLSGIYNYFSVQTAYRQS